MTLNKRLLTSAIVIAAFGAAGTASAAVQSGNLEVTTTITAACSVPSPAGTLDLPFQNNVGLDAQAISGTAIKVTVNCTGSPTVSKVAFGPGVNQGSVASPDTDIRYMITDVPLNEETDFLGYKLFASVANDITGSEGLITATTDPKGWVGVTTANSTELGLDGTGTTEYYVNGKIYEGARSVHASASEVPAGIYKDTVVMTVTYG